MSLLEHKFSETDFAGADISSLSDRPNADGLTGQQLRERFDNVGKNMLAMGRFNALVDALAALGADSLVASADLDRIKHLRLNAQGVLEVSSDGQSWREAGGQGHEILNAWGEALPQRKKLKFEQSQVRDEGGATVVAGIKGEQGPQGEPGLPGLKGERGEAGAAGKTAYQAAQEGGFAGSEVAFNSALAGVSAHMANKLNPHAVTAAQVGAAVNMERSASLSAVWEGEQAPYAQTVAVTGMLASDSPIIDVDVAQDVETGLAQIGAFALISRIEAQNGAIRAYCYGQKPEIPVPLAIKVVR